jgi:hypothetical protein
MLHNLLKLNLADAPSFTITLLWYQTVSKWASSLKMSHSLHEPLSAPPPPYVEREEGCQADFTNSAMSPVHSAPFYEDACTAAPIPTIAKLASSHDHVKGFAIEIWKDVQKTVLNKLNSNYNIRFPYQGSGNRQPNPIECQALVADWDRFNEELMQGFECTWVDMGNSNGSRWCVQYRLMSKAEFPGPPTNEFVLPYWKKLRGCMETLEIMYIECTHQQQLFEASTKKIMEESAKSGKDQALILLTSEQYSFIRTALDENVKSVRTYGCYTCKYMRKLAPLNNSDDKRIYDKLKKDHLQDIDSPVKMGDWYVVEWENPWENSRDNSSCCTIC